LAPPIDGNVVCNEVISLHTRKEITLQTTLTSKGQMTLPSAVRARMGLVAGDQLLVTLQDADTIVLKRPAATNVSLRGLLARPKTALTVAQMNAGVASHLMTKHAARQKP
jgi:AbrB family looped-hinge helix DNA binding protein